MIGIHFALHLSYICIVIHRFLPGPFGLANGFFSSSPTLGVAAPLPGALPSPPPTLISETMKASSISFGSEVSIFLEASTDEYEVSIDLADANTPRAAEEYTILCLIGEPEGQAYMNTNYLGEGLVIGEWVGKGTY
jgi:hypothetical protein